MAGRLTTEQEYNKAKEDLAKKDEEIAKRKAEAAVAEEKLKKDKAAIIKRMNLAKERMNKQLFKQFCDFYKVTYKKEFTSTNDLKIIKEEHEIASDFLSSAVQAPEASEETAAERQ